MLQQTENALHKSLERKKQALRELKKDEDFMFFIQENEIRHAALMIQRSVYCSFQQAKDLAVDVQNEIRDGLLCP